MKILLIIGMSALISVSCGPQSLKKSFTSLNGSSSGNNGNINNPSLADADCRTKLQSNSAFCHAAVSSGSSSCALCQVPPPSGMCYLAAPANSAACLPARVAVNGGYYDVNALLPPGPAWLIPASGQPMALQGNTCVYRTYGSTSVQGCSIVAADLGLRVTAGSILPNAQ